MKRWIALLLMMACVTGTDHVAPAAASGETPVVGCRQVSTIRLRVRLSTPTGPTQALTTDIRRVVNDVWAAYGVSIDWELLDSARDLSRVDVWILARYGPIERHPHALGAVTFSSQGGVHLARLSLGAAVALVQADLPVHRGLSAVLRGLPTMHLGDSGARATRLVASAAAHELGHLLIGSKAHSATGLMIADYASLHRYGEHGAGALDARSHERLLQRLDATVSCPD